MLKPILIALILFSAAQQGCSTCSDAEKKSCASGAHWCTERTDCHQPGTNSSGTPPGIVTAIGTCSDATAHLVVPPPFFTPRTSSPILAEDHTPDQCQAFDVVWNACNAGSVTSVATPYTVTFRDQVPPGNVGLDITNVYTAPPLSPCACDTKILPFSGFHCNEAGFIPTKTDITTSLKAQNAVAATGYFTVGM